MRIYIGCGLTHVPRELFAEYAEFIHTLAAELRTGGARREVKYALVDSDPQLAGKPFEERARLCYLWDRDMVEASDLLIAEASFPSTGLGIEMQIAAAREIPIILCYRDFGENRMPTVEYETPDHSRHSLQVGEGFVSLMALGMPSIYRVVKHVGDETAISQILDAAALLEKE